MVMLLSLHYYSLCMVRLMKGKQTLCHRFKLGGSIVSYCLIYFGLLQNERNKQIKSLWAVKKKKTVTILPNNGRHLQITLSLGKSPVHKGYYSSAPKPWLISGRNTSPPRLLHVSKEQRNNTLLRKEKYKRHFQCLPREEGTTSVIGEHRGGTDHAPFSPFQSAFS